MKPIGIGTLSHAHGHLGVYLNVMKDFDDVDLISVWDDDQGRGRSVADGHEMGFCSDALDVVDDPRVDAVMIGCETNRHAEFVEMAANAGKHILLQKPMATTLEDCDRIAEAVKRSGVEFSMAWQMRHDPMNIEMKRLLDDGVVGKTAVVRRRHCINVLLNPDFVNGPTQWHMDPISNIGMFFDDASHTADWFLWMLGKPASVIAEIDAIVTDVSPDDNGAAIFRFAGGEIGILLNSSTTVAAVSTTEIYGDEGTIIQDFGDAPSTHAPHPKDVVPLRYIRQGQTEWNELPLRVPESHGERIGAVARPFVDYLKGETDEHVGAQEGRLATEMVVGAYMSAKAGRRITFPL